jgi:hypothetical protein
MTEKLCGRDECVGVSDCDEEACHCEYGLMLLIDQAELRADLAKEGYNEI